MNNHLSFLVGSLYQYVAFISVLDSLILKSTDYTQVSPLPLDCCLYGFFLFFIFTIQPLAQVYLKWVFFFCRQHIFGLCIFICLYNSGAEIIHFENIHFMSLLVCYGLILFDVCFSVAMAFVCLLCASLLCFIFQLHWELVGLIF